jgi:hypothetical protein
MDKTNFSKGLLIMMKTILFAAAFMTLALVTMGSTSAYACGTCGCAKAKMEKPACKKCAEAGKKCKCAMKKDKPCMKKAKSEKPCVKCDKSERAFQMKKRSNIFFNE